MQNIIKSLRILKGYTQEHAATALGITIATYNSKEANPDRFKVGEIKKLANFLEVPESIFFEKDFAFATKDEVKHG